MKTFLVAGILGLAALDSQVIAQGYIWLSNDNPANLISYGPFTGQPVGNPVSGLNVGMYYFVGDVAATVNAAFVSSFSGGNVPMMMIPATGSGATAVLGANGFPAGMFGASEPFSVPGASVGSVVTIVVVAYDGFNYDFSFMRGHSQAFTMIAGAAPPSTGSYMNGFQVVTSIPEPTSLALVGLGLGVLTLWRRRSP